MSQDQDPAYWASQIADISDSIRTNLGPLSPEEFALLFGEAIDLRNAIEFKQTRAA